MDSLRTQPMIPEAEAFERLDRALADRRLPAERVALAEARGRVLAAGARSAIDMPSFDKSAMDGYAVRADDLRDEYRVVGTLAAGDAPEEPLAPGQAVQIMTGAPLPDGAGRVIKVEQTERDGESVRVTAHDNARHVRLRAEDLAAGDPVLPAGTRLGTLELSNLVSCGLTEVEVVRHPTAVVLSTGDELVDAPEALSPGKIMDSNGPMLAGLCAGFGIQVLQQRRVPDDQAATRQAMAAAVEQADLVLLSGGVSMGEFDYVLDGFEALDLTVHFSRVAIKPGKPTVFATRNDAIVFGLPGNPVSAFVMFHLFVLRAAAQLTGAPLELRQVQLRLAADFRRRKAGRLLYMPCALTPEGTATPIPNNGSGHLAALLGADGFVQVPVGVDALAAGERVTFLPLPRHC